MRKLLILCLFTSTALSASMETKEDVTAGTPFYTVSTLNSPVKYDREKHKRLFVMSPHMRRLFAGTTLVDNTKLQIDRMDALTPGSTPKNLTPLSDSEIRKDSPVAAGVNREG